MNAMLNRLRWSREGEKKPAGGPPLNRFRPSLELLESRLNPVSLGFAIDIGGTNIESGNAIAMDSAGNCYVTGFFSGSADFDPGAGNAVLTVAGQNAFVAKYSPTGALIYARQLGATEGLGIAVDSGGNVLITGRFSGTKDFDPGPGTFNLTSVGSSDICIAKLNSNGDFVWAVGIGGSAVDRGTAIAIDGLGNVVVTGEFQNTADFDPGPGTFTLSSGGSDDVFVVKLDSTGAFVWADVFAGVGLPASDTGYAIAADAVGNVFITGGFDDLVDFDPGPGTLVFDNYGSSWDSFVAKLDSAGNLVWAAQLGGNLSNEWGRGIAVDASGNVYSTGYFDFSGDFDPGPGNFALAPIGSNPDVYVSKLDSAGRFVWAKRMGGPNDDVGFGIGLDASDNIFITGSFQNTADFDPGAGAFNVASSGAEDVFVASLDGAGNFIWAGGMGGLLSDQGRGIAVDTGGNFASIGSFNGTADFDPSPGAYNLISAGNADIFISGLKAAGVTLGESSGNTLVNESGATDTFTVFLEAAPTANVVVTLTPGSQFTISSTVLTFITVNWNIAQTVTVSALDDALAEGAHSGTITTATSSSDTDYNALVVAPLTVNVIDNDTPGITVIQSAGSTSLAEGGAADSYTVVLTSQPTANVTITLSTGTQITAAPTVLTFNSASWNVVQTITLTAIDDVVVEGPHTGVVTHAVVSPDSGYNGFPMAGITSSITDNDFAQGVIITQTAVSTDVSEAGSVDSYTVVLNSLPTANVVITLRPASQLVTSPPTLTFTPAGWNTPQTVVVQAIDDAIAQGTRTQPITHAATSSDPLYNGIVIAAVTVNITDNDVAGLTLVPTTIDLTENGASNTYTAVLNSQPTANVIVNLAGDSQVSLATSTLVFTPGNWNVAQTISVRAVDDTLAEGLHNGLITHTLASGDTVYIGMTGTVTARINDNDNPGVLISQTNGPLVILEGTSKTYTAVLNTPPTSDVVLNINPDPQVSVAPASITFTPGDWNVPRPVVVTANDDGIEEGDHIGRITHTTTSGTSSFNNLTVASVTANIVDNDGAAVFGTERADQILVSFTPANIKVTVNGRITTLPNTFTQLLLFAGYGNDSIQILAPTIPVVVIGGPGVDKLFITGQIAGNNFILGDSVVNVNGQSVGVWETESLTIGGKAGNDTFTVQDVPAFPVELKGDAGIDVVVGPSRPNSWQITGPNAGTLDTSIKLSAFENWTGGTGADSFVFAAGKAITGRVDGGLGQNTLDFSTATAAITVNLQTGIATGSKSIANITTVVGGKGSADKLLAADQSNLWNITAANSGNVSGVSFRNFENLTGGAQDDTFLLADNQGVKGKIDGALGVDILDFTAYLSRPVSVNLQLKAATNTGGFANLEQFQGGSGSADSFVGLNKINLWNVTGAGSGDVAGIAFGNFENLTGGTLADNFTLDSGADWLGTLNGGTGTDTLIAFPGPNSWLLTGLNTGTLNGRKFGAVEIRR